MMRRAFLLIALWIVSCSAKQSQDKIKEGQKHITCFIYHRFGDARYPTTNTPVKDFEAHLVYLKQNHYTVLSFSDAISYLHSDEKEQNVAVITIDDAYKTFFKNGLPLLKKYGMPATLFINTKTVGGGDYMTWSDLKVAMKNNMEIGNHTHSHDYFLNTPAPDCYEVFRKEIEMSQSIILKNLDIKPTVFSYPYGEFDIKMKTIVKDIGFIAAAAQNSGVISASGDFFQCPRFPMSEAYSASDKFIEKVRMKPFNIVRESPVDFIMNDKQPVLTLTLQNDDLKLNQLRCFVQGGSCVLTVKEKQGDATTIEIRSTRPIASRRRTLYTVTAPDAHGTWHWHSHLWINAKVKD